MWSEKVERVLLHSSIIDGKSAQTAAHSVRQRNDFKGMWTWMGENGK